MSTHYVALDRAQDLANKHQQPAFVVTRRGFEDQDYDATTAGSLNRETVVVTVVYPTPKEERGT